MSKVSERFWETCVYQAAKKVDSAYTMSNKDLTSVANVYEKAGGTWEALATGGTGEWDLLRRVCKIYIKRQLKAKAEDEK